jgi:hypothetical protein
MFDDSKDKIRRHNSEKEEASSLSPDVIAKLQSKGLDPETVTFAQLFPETLDPDGNDLSLMSGTEWEIMITYAKATEKALQNKQKKKNRRRPPLQPLPNRQAPHATSILSHKNQTLHQRYT